LWSIGKQQLSSDLWLACELLLYPVPLESNGESSV